MKDIIKIKVEERSWEQPEEVYNEEIDNYEETGSSVTKYDITGFHKVPQTVIRYVALQAAIQCLIYASANITGQAGIASKSIGIDGLSQSVTSTANATKIAFGALIDSYTNEMKKLEDILEANYVGFTIGSL